MTARSPSAGSLPGRAKAWKADLRAGITVAVFAVPQAMAYSVLAGVPPVYGLYGAIVMAAVSALFGSSRFLNTGPTNSAALLTASALAPIAGTGNIPLVCTLTLMVGLLRYAMGVLRLGRLLDFIPESAFLGFTVGAGLLIALSQLHHLLGVAAPTSSWFPAKIFDTGMRLHEFDGTAIMIGLAVAGFIAAVARKAPWFPAGLVAVALSGAAAWWLRDIHPVAVVRDIGAIPRGWPSLVLPVADFSLWVALFPSALAIALVGLVEAASIGQSLALRHREAYDVNREFRGQGLSQLAGALVGAIPGSGSFTRSKLMEMCGAKTRAANLWFSGATALLVALIPGLLGWIPMAALAGLLIYIGVCMVDVPRLRRLFQTSRADVWVFVITLAVTVFGRIEYGLLAGMVAGAAAHLQRSRELHLVEYLPGPGGRIQEAPYDRTTPHPSKALVALGVSGDLFYGVAMELREQLEAIIKSQQPRHVVFRLRRAHSIDYSCWSVLMDAVSAFHREGGRWYFCGVAPEDQAMLRQAGLPDILPEDRIFPATPEPFEAFRLCLASIEDDSAIAQGWGSPVPGASAPSGIRPAS